MSLRIDSTEWIAGALLIGETGLGVLGAAIPSTGDSGAGYAYNDLSLPADNAKEICGRITTWPALGTLTAFEDTSFEFTGPDGSHSFQYQLYVDGVATGSPSTVALTIGAVNGAATATLQSLALTAPTATAIGTIAGDGTATASMSSVQLTAPAAIASGTNAGAAVASAAIAAIALTSPSASAYSTANVTASATLRMMQLTAPTGHATGSGLFTRAPSGAGPQVILSSSRRPHQVATKRPAQQNTRRF